jgi:hypothetical protein
VPAHSYHQETRFARVNSGRTSSELLWATMLNIKPLPNETLSMIVIELDTPILGGGPKDCWASLHDAFFG